MFLVVVTMNWIKSRLGESAVLLSAVLWGSIGIFTRALNQIGFSAVQIVAVRAIITALTMAVFLTLKNPKLFKIKLRDLWMFFGTGICSFLFFNIFSFPLLVKKPVTYFLIIPASKSDFNV